jgi:hypothetical protein
MCCVAVLRLASPNTGNQPADFDADVLAPNRVSFLLRATPKASRVIGWGMAACLFEAVPDMERPLPVAPRYLSEPDFSAGDDDDSRGYAR